MDEFLKAMGMRIMLRRKELELTQEAVAERAGLTAQTISTAERGSKALRPENVAKLSIALEVSTDYLLLGGATQISLDRFSSRVSKISPMQRVFLDKIIENYLEALMIPNSEEMN